MTDNQLELAHSIKDDAQKYIDQIEKLKDLERFLDNYATTINISAYKYLLALEDKVHLHTLLQTLIKEKMVKLVELNAKFKAI